MTASARVICDSVSPDGIRITTMQVRFHRYVLAEMNTHRAFSRNYRSSRAVPVEKLLAELRNGFIAWPDHWGANEKGMQSSKALEGEALKDVQDAWYLAMKGATEVAEFCMAQGLHKQVANRLLEPFLYVSGVITATHWKNFFSLRLDPGAAPEMRSIASLMYEAYATSTPKKLEHGDWHLPYADNVATGGSIANLIEGVPEEHYREELLKHLIKVSVARCARVSYKMFDTGEYSKVEEDLALYDKLLGSKPIHASPAEHQASPDRIIYPNNLAEGAGGWAMPGLHGNFSGWKQYRKTLEGEACSDLPPGYDKIVFNEDLPIHLNLFWV